MVYRSEIKPGTQFRRVVDNSIWYTERRVFRFGGHGRRYSDGYNIPRRTKHPIYCVWLRRKEGPANRLFRVDQLTNNKEWKHVNTAR